MRQSWDIRLYMPSACTSEVGTYSNTVARTTFRHQLLEFADRFWNSVIHGIMRCVWKVLLPSVFRRTPYKRPSIDVLKSRWNVSSLSSLTCTAALPPFPGKNSNGYKGPFVQCQCPVVRVLVMEGSIGGAWAGHGIGTLPFFLESRNQTRHFLWYVWNLCRSIETGDNLPLGEPMVNPRTTSR